MDIASKSLVFAALRGEAPTWSIADNGVEVQDCLEWLGCHGVGPLLWEAMNDRQTWRTWPKDLRTALNQERIALTALELVRRRELSRVLAAFQNEGITALVLKGAALAYGRYPDPLLRPRTDTDILVAPRDRERAGKVLLTLGYRKPLAIEGDYIKTQAQYLNERLNPRFTIDLHWRLTNSHVFADTLPFDELWFNSDPLTGLTGSARMPSKLHALLHACVHRALNLPHGEGQRLIWLYDIHLLAEELDDDEWRTFSNTASQKSLCAVSAEALSVVRQHFGTRVPQWLMGALASDSRPVEPSALLLTAGPLKARYLSYRALPSWAARFRMLREQMFPSAVFMRKRFGVAGRGALALAYMH